MPYMTFPYELPPLAFSYNALEPYIDTETMYQHHDKHFATYIKNLNATLEPYPKLQKLTLTQLLTRSSFLPVDVYMSIMHNGGGVYNHMMFFEGLAPAGEGTHKPNGLLLAAINKTFGSLEYFKKTFSEQALDIFGSGWLCLGMTPAKNMKIYSLANQETVLELGAVPVLMFDMWEHAYYLKYKSARAEYVHNIWNVATFCAR